MQDHDDFGLVPFSRLDEKEIETIWDQAMVRFDLCDITGGAHLLRMISEPSRYYSGLRLP